MMKSIIKDVLLIDLFQLPLQPGKLPSYKIKLTDAETRFTQVELWSADQYQHVDIPIGTPVTVEVEIKPLWKGIGLNVIKITPNQAAAKPA